MKDHLQYIDIIKKSPLFCGTNQNETLSMLECLSPETRKYEKGQYILRFGDNTEAVCMTLNGRACIQKEDYWGNRNIISTIMPGQLFAEAFACTPGAALQVDVIASEQTTVLFMNVKRILSTCSSSCAFHNRLIQNLLSVLASKNILINEKLSHISQRSTREKLLSYFLSESLRQSKTEFDIPYNRQQLADYLSVERSAMSNELCKMRKEGLLNFHKNHIELLKNTQFHD